MNPKREDNSNPRWEQLYAAAMVELDPIKLLQRIADAHRAILDQIEDQLTRPSDGQHRALNDALHTLHLLRKVADSESQDLPKDLPKASQPILGAT